MSKIKLVADGPNLKSEEYVYEELNDCPKDYVKELQNRGYTKFRLVLAHE